MDERASEELFNSEIVKSEILSKEEHGEETKVVSQFKDKDDSNEEIKELIRTEVTESIITNRSSQAKEEKREKEVKLRETREEEVVVHIDTNIHSKDNNDVFILGAGIGRTGTMSLQAALEILDYPCYHMKEIHVNDHGDLWLRITNGEKGLFKQVFSKYKGTLDNPACLYWEEILKEFPNSKVILTIRDPKKWYQSFKSTVLAQHRNKGNGVYFLAWFLPYIHRFFIFQELHISKFLNDDYSEENCIKIFNEHNENVISKCPKDKLLIYKVEEGWEPLCKFLGKKKPDIAFPKINDANDFNNRIWKINIVGYLVMTILIGSTAGLGYWIKKKYFR